jgi:hypothetical protein
MSDDLLERATRAARETHTPASSADGELGRRRLERALDAPPRPGKKRLTVAVLVAASFATTAWAAVTGRLPAVMRDAFVHDDLDAVAVAPPPSTAPSASGEAVRDEASAVETLPPPVEDEPRAETAPEATSSPPELAARSHDAPSSVRGDDGTRARAPRAGASTEHRGADADALYREAHDAHFARKDPARALAAWDRYLAAAGPDGRMTLEARYNRAIALVRLGRAEDAKRALEPFARGEYGGYRREEAIRLIESLP